MRLYHCRIDAFEDLAGAQYLPPARRARMERYRHQSDKARCLVAGLLLRAALGHAAAQIEEGENGKPCLSGGPCFNLSHSGDYVILGVSDRELGVDVERIAPWNDRVARRCFLPAELSWLYADPTENAFFRLWTAKESVMKATGLGFSMPPSSFSVLPMEDGPHGIEGRVWHLTWLALPGHAVCTAAASPEKPEIRALSRDALLGNAPCITRN